jgi:glycyl-tRNA synthetase beta chain
MAARDLLIEIGTEELPPKALPVLSAALADSMSNLLAQASLEFESVKKFASPRRLALLITHLQETQQDTEQTRFGPAVNVAFQENGEPTPAALGFARSCGVEVSELQRSNKDGVEKLCFVLKEKGKAANELIPGMLEQSLSQLPIPKRMRWGSSRAEFVRPVHWLVVLFGEGVIDCEILGVTSGRETWGHRFHHNSPIALVSPDDYEAKLESPGLVIADFHKRKSLIKQQVESESEKLGASPIYDDALLEEVTSLVEYPVALTGDFEAEYLEVPQEALILTMQKNQKCFCLVGDDGKLLPKFITISNLISKDPAQVVEGNERVIRPRLADARFFFETDKQIRLESRREGLGKLIFQEKLGSVLDKSRRVEVLAKDIAAKLGVDQESCGRAAVLSKCDLLTAMVGEFADLQGLMGYYYALNDGEDPNVAAALNEQYQPRFAGDSVPGSDVGAVLAIADKLDTMVGMFGIEQPPTGSKDPFALRRAALGILRIATERSMALDLAVAINTSVNTYSNTSLAPSTAQDVFEFILERFKAWYLDEGIGHGEFQSVYVLRPTKPLDFHRRVQAVQLFARLPEAANLAAANKRVSNILSKNNGLDIPATVNESLLSDSEEVQLYRELASKELEVAPIIDSGDYAAALACLTSLKITVDAFFDKVLVMADDESIKKNRMALLQRLQSLFIQVADISYLHQS